MSEKQTKKKQKKKRNQNNQNNREYSFVLYLFTGLFVMLIGYVSMFQITKSREVINNPYNARLEAFENKVIRGSRREKKPRIQKPRTQKSVRIQMDSCHFSDQNSLRAVFFVPDFDLSFFLYHLEKMKEEKT